jgi:signal transduction histidine kinase
VSAWAYLRGHVAGAACGLGVCALVGAVLAAAGAGTSLAVLVCVLVAGAFATAGAANYLHERRCARALAQVAADPEAALELAADLRGPSCPLGEAAFAAVEAVRADAAARVGAAQGRELDYRSYLEAWVHEAKTPLAAAGLMAQALPDGAGQPIARELDRADAYVEQVLYYARSTALHNDYLLRTCSLRDLVGEALKSRAHAVVGAHVAIGMEGLDVEVPTDPKWTVFALGQVIDNAVRYRAPEGARIDFSARVEDAGGADERVVLTVADNGCGVPARDVGRVFEKGFTGTNGRTHARSTGIGLYLVRELCAKMGVGVSFASEEGAGSRVAFSFPVNRTHLFLTKA